MATSAAKPALERTQVRSDDAAEEAVVEDGQALVHLEPAAEEDGDALLSGLAARLPVELDVLIPVRNFRVRGLLALQPGEVIASQWTNGEDLPLAAGAVQLAWSEFEVVNTQLAVRITRLI